MLKNKWAGGVTFFGISNQYAMLYIGKNALLHTNFSVWYNVIIAFIVSVSIVINGDLYGYGTESFAAKTGTPKSQKKLEHVVWIS